MVLHDHAEIFDDVPWEDLSDADQQAYLDEARAAFLAMVENWSGKDIVGYGPPFYGIDLILPLTEKQEKRDE